MFYVVCKEDIEDQSVEDFIVSSITSPPPRPNCPGEWFLLRGEHWLLFNKEHGLNVYWMSMTDEAISLVTAQENLYRMGLINAQQKGLLEGIKPVPIKNHSRLQRHVFEFANGFLTTTNHLLAPWNQVTHGIRQDANGVWSPYDLIGY
jgi:hypothetical protein